MLAVEDNPSLRRVVVRQLSELGYRVSRRQPPARRSSCWKREPVDLVFTDVVLPGGMNGYELARAALDALARASSIVLTSGFPESRIAADGVLSNIKLLSKPYRKEDIARVIREVDVGTAR